MELDSIPSDVEGALKEAGINLKHKMIPTSSRHTERLKCAHRCK